MIVYCPSHGTAQAHRRVCDLDPDHWTLYLQERQAMNRYKVILDLGARDVEEDVFWTYSEALNYAYDRMSASDVLLNEDTNVHGLLATFRATIDGALTAVGSIEVSA